ncbi:FAD-dependent 5-carboxymethylaminomethyl-2-thiouridine(34) oxidoreductase MnmC [Paucibacter sp. O1-1]|nr:FAD-dependent 5-carboxymethylaminomethyl-2-thiouridine(34) oxidoreductase MnmC [Paucibacter sp. O1-1]MDA3824812.1 FAD-dependent 5-carboxymethylaminomethyl-2-thiouridine(34) oxidoreductase MnmC [Paucibacter sp. O1-1]
MKTQPILPARVDFSDAAAPAAPEFGDIYHARAGAFGQARHVFLGGNGLPQRWAGQARFVILETGFGLGSNFLASWAAWREDPARCERLFFISIEKHPLRREDMARAHATSPEPALAAELLAAWPPLTPNLHNLSFEGGRVQLLLALGDVRDWLKTLVAEVDAIYLDGFAPARNPAMWDGYTLKLLARLAKPGASASTWSTAPAVIEGLSAAGFAVEKRPGFAKKGRMSVARFAPRHLLQRPAARQALAPAAREVLVIGAGLAGAACAWALRREGLGCTVLDSHAAVAQGSSGNPGGLFHGTLNPDDGLHARFNRAAALATGRALAELPALPWLQRGLLRLEAERDIARMRAQIARLGLPEDYVQALDAEAAQALAGLAHGRPAWFYPGGGALPPADYVRALLGDTPLRLGRRIASLRPGGAGWRALDEDGALLAEAPAVVLAGGHLSLRLLQDLAPDLALPLTRQRGQISHLAQATPLPALPLAGAGYALADGAGGLWCGATSQDEDDDPALRPADQRRNLEQWAELARLPEVPEAALSGRVGWRLLAPDRLPLVGGLPLGPQGREDQPRLLPRLPGLLLCSALGSRGISWAALCGQVAAAQLTGAPLPLEADLLDAIDPARFRVRESRRPTRS